MKTVQTDFRKEVVVDSPPNPVSELSSVTFGGRSIPLVIARLKAVPSLASAISGRHDIVFD